MKAITLFADGKNYLESKKNGDEDRTILNYYYK